MLRIFPVLLLATWHMASFACDPLPGLPGEDVTIQMEHEGVQRSFVLHLPTGYDCVKPLPLVVGVHGFSGTGSRLENQYMQIFDHINEHNYIGVFPDGLSASEEHQWARGFNDLTSRNDSGPDGLTCVPPPFDYPMFDNCPESDKERQCYWGNSCADDLGFFRKLIEHMLETYSVDSSRVYMTGHSQGGSTINGLAPELDDLLAAVAPMQGFATNGYAKGATESVAFLQAWGRQDETVPGTGVPASDNLIYESADESAEAWAGAQGCSENGDTPYPTVSDGKYGWSCTQHADCRDGSEVVTCAWDGGHTWPREGDDGFGYDVIWNFFQKHSKPSRPVVDERPNIVLIVADDLGYADLGAYGGDISTPNIDSLAEEGMLFTQFHTASSCAPTRAMLLSGNNNHVAGMARQNVTGILKDPHPGYENHLSDRIVPFPELLQESGYHTYMAGKWHLGTALEHSPVSKGFERSFALLAGAGDHWSATGFHDRRSTYREDEEMVDWPEGAYSTELYTDKLIEYMESNRGDGKPFFVFAAYTSPHWPLTVPDEYLDIYRGEYDDGYDELRVQRFESLKTAGIIPGDSEIPPRNDTLTPWEELDEEQKRTESREMELYAAMVDNLDDHVGRIITYLKGYGLYDNTLIIFMGDNGAAAEDFYNGKAYGDYLRANYHNDYENMGKPGSWVSYGKGWAEAGSAPFSRYKAYTREGGMVAPMIISGKGVSSTKTKSSTYLTVMDLAPTFLELAGVEFPVRDELQPMRGASMSGLLDGRSDAIHGDDYVTVYSHSGRAFIRKGRWKMSNLGKPFDESKFELFDVIADPGETRNLAEVEPDKYQELLELWRIERKELGIVLPQDL